MWMLCEGLSAIPHMDSISEKQGKTKQGIWN